MTFTIALLPGDGIGPEVVAQGRRVLDRAAELFGHEVRYHEGLMGGCAIDATGVAPLRRDRRDVPPRRRRAPRSGRRPEVGRPQGQDPP